MAELPRFAGGIIDVRVVVKEKRGAKAVKPGPDEVLEYLTKQGVEFTKQQPGVERQIHCPRGDNHEHGDQNPSASVNLEKRVMKCHVPSCGLQGGIDKLWRDLGWERPPWLRSDSKPDTRASNGHDDLPTQWKGRPIKEWYRYERADGSTAYHVARVEHVDDGKRIKEFPVYCNRSWGLKVKRAEKVPYRLQKVTKATDVFIVEGEKDVHTLESMGLVGTTSLGGAGKFLPEYAKYFNKDQHVVILPDNDEPGCKHAEQVAAVLNGHVASIKILKLPNLPPSGDVSDWAENRDPQEAGEELCRLADGAPEHREKQTDDSGLWAGQIYTLEEAFKPRPERQYVVTGLISLPSLTIVYGPPGGLKSFVVADLAICVSAGILWLAPLPEQSGDERE
jgi:hypothetical protein